MMGIMHQANGGDILCFISRRLVLTTSCSSNFPVIITPNFISTFLQSYSFQFFPFIKSLFVHIIQLLLCISPSALRGLHVSFVIPFFGPVHYDSRFGLWITWLWIYGCIGVVLGLGNGHAKARRDGLDPDIINRVVTWMIVGIFVGGHLGFAFMYEPEGAEEGLVIFSDTQDGLSSFGGFYDFIALYIFFYKENQRVRKANVLRKEQGRKTSFSRSNTSLR